VWLAQLALHPLVLVRDGGGVGRGWVALMRPGVYTGRALPWAWQVRKGQQGPCPAALPMALVKQGQTLSPLGAAVVWLGDGECAGPTLPHTLQNAPWSYVVRPGSASDARRWRPGSSRGLWWRAGLPPSRQPPRARCGASVAGPQALKSRGLSARLSPRQTRPVAGPPSVFALTPFALTRKVAASISTKRLWRPPRGGRAGCWQPVERLAGACIWGRSVPKRAGAA
jgi:hypothetical protein